MAVAFKNVKSRNIGAAATGIGTYTVPAVTTSVVTSLTVANVTANTIIVEVSVYDTSNDYFIAKGVEILAGGSLVIAGDDRLILNTLESVRVKSDTATSCDAVMSLMEYT
jgi:hypothetical protein